MTRPPLSAQRDQLAPPLAVEHHPGRELVRRGQHHRRGRRWRAARRPAARAPSTGTGGVSSRQLRRCCRTPSEPGSSTATVSMPSALQHLGEQAERLGDAGDDDHLVRVGAGCPGCGPASWRPPAAARASRAGRRSRRPAGARSAQHRPLGAQPGRAGKRRQIGHAGRQVDPRRGRPQRVEHVGARARAATLGGRWPVAAVRRRVRAPRPGRRRRRCRPGRARRRARPRSAAGTPR